ncbi:hypothetical protein ACFS5N_16610 [Mucilaginibacter ximonensis]|uniref:Uncharacterized protein n=1 Tax=Mucilaginibacter ximonensis TaxID=538021 RepID=A0ABW5YFQ2_9SPHI
MEEPVKNPQKKFTASLVINGSMTIYALCTFISALNKGELWRILVSGTGLLFFAAALVVIVVNMRKLRKEQKLEA